MNEHLEPHRAKSVVIVEDDKDARESLQQVLELLGYEVSAAGDGVSGSELIRARRPDVALVDVGLPGLNGYQVAAGVRSDPDLAGTKLVALTGYGRETEEQALAAGFDEQATKPLDLDALERLLH